jgi:peroxiredoxin
MMGQKKVTENIRASSDNIQDTSQAPGNDSVQGQKPPRLRWAKDNSMTVILGLIAVALIVGIRDPDTAPMTAALPISQRKPMPDFTFQTLDGKPWTLSEHRGHVVLLNFWATWCPPCQSETPSLVKIASVDQARGLDVVGISMDQRDQNGLSNIRAFVSAYHVPYPVLLPNAFSPVTDVVQAYPTTYLIDREGRVAQTHVGALDEASARREVERLLKEPTPSKEGPPSQ